MSRCTAQHRRNVATYTGAMIGLGRLAAGSVCMAALALVACAPAPQPSPTHEPSASPTSGVPGEPTALSVERVEVDDLAFDVVRVDLERWDVRVSWDFSAGGVFLEEAVASLEDAALVTNAGIYTDSVEPGGLLVAGGVEMRGINLRAGGGNFHLLPNGVFLVRDDGTAAVVDSTAYNSDGVLHATQSGPALVLDGVIHPAFDPQSTNRALRSGVGVSDDGTVVYFAISRANVTFHEFARLYVEHLGVNNALYLDGSISGLWVRGERETDGLTGPFAGIISVHPRTEE